MSKDELAGIAAQLYAKPFDDFIPARAAAAKDLLAGSAATADTRSRAAVVRSLPKPSVGAWAVNMLAWQRPGVLRELAELGIAMRQAQDGLDAAALRSLGGERRALLAGAVRAAREVAEQQGRRISGTVAADVEETLRAATADQGAAAAVRSGRLLRTLSADGVDVVDLTGAVAVPEAPGPAADPGSAPAPPTAPAGPRLRAVGQERPAPGPSARERARAALEDAALAAKSSSAEEERTTAALQDASRRADALARDAARLAEELAAAESGLRKARKLRDAAAAAAQQAARVAGKDRRREDLARERVLRLGDTPAG
ncbi:MAG TPA: hypothetical protein VFN00_02155 [Arthrobacter sp.]|nr:hypothetical protein [Arthrobacter sp.]